MTDIVLQVRDAVVGEIEEDIAAESFTTHDLIVKAAYVPPVRLAELVQLQPVILVMPSNRTIEAAARKRFQHNIFIDVAFAGRHTSAESGTDPFPADVSDLDDYFTTAGELLTMFHFDDSVRRFETDPVTQWVRSTQELIWQPDQLQAGVFVSVMTHEFLAHEKP